MATRPITPPLRQSTPIDDGSDEDSPLTQVSDTDDHTYSPQSEPRLKRAKVMKVTPTKRRKTGSSVATYARENAIEASRASRSFFSSSLAPSPVLLNHYLGPVPCLISGKQLLTDCVETCHVIPKAVDHATLDKLEYLWGFKYFTFNVDTRSNLIHLNASLHGAFDRQGWFLLPSETRLVEDLDRATLTSPPQHVIHERPLLKLSFPYRYNFVPLPPMEASSFSIYTGNYSIEPSFTDTTLHFFPFAELPTFLSHVHPHYAIYNLGQKLQSFFGDDLEDADSGFDIFAAKLRNDVLPVLIRQCYRLYRRWMQCQVPTSFLRGEGEESDEQSRNPHNIALHPAQGNPDTRMTRSHSRSEHGSRGGNSTTGNAAGPMERAYGGTDPQDEICFKDPPDNVMRPDDSISCLDGPPNEDNEERCAGDDGSSDVSDDSELWTQDIRAWQMDVRHALSKKEDLGEGSSSSGSSSGSCSESNTVVVEDPLNDKESMIVAVKSGDSVVFEGSPLIRICV